MEKRISQVAELVRIKPEEMINWDNLYSMRMNWEVYGFLMSLTFFHNQHCEENIIDMEKLSMNWKLEESPREDLSLRALRVCQRAKIETMHDLVNYPSIELFKIKSCGLATIRDLKKYIMKAIQVIGYVRIPGLKGRRSLKVVNDELFTDFSENTRKDIKEWLGDDVA
ncbi:MAG: hypothetical protein K9N09_09135 [Candidatus Cloacimonetes bacterium]|nr:hypothetical protein [Candidatus Cloacimonadota bacterium]MCF7814200.1 hypothetical protein [Candidatus Cloacimonadota bacterium]MCF7868851.1 hypothetical protein [Candidatus Cloacimonadota bacterium]MCF7884256.1 hypothetical protein [Candidatus Cloacimonadota bacterium]